MGMRSAQIAKAFGVERPTAHSPLESAHCTVHTCPPTRPVPQSRERTASTQQSCSALHNGHIPRVEREAGRLSTGDLGADIDDI